MRRWGTPRATRAQPRQHTGIAATGVAEQLPLDNDSECRSARRDARAPRDTSLCCAGRVTPCTSTRQRSCCRADPRTRTRLPVSWNGRGRRRTVSTTANTAVVVSKPNASVVTATSPKPSDRRSRRSAMAVSSRRSLDRVVGHDTIARTSIRSDRVERVVTVELLLRRCSTCRRSVRIFGG